MTPSRVVFTDDKLIKFWHVTCQTKKVTFLHKQILNKVNESDKNVKLYKKITQIQMVESKNKINRCQDSMWFKFLFKKNMDIYGGLHNSV